MLFVYGLVRRCGAPAVKVRLDGLDRAATYKVREINRWQKDAAHVNADGQALSGAALCDLGLFTRLGPTYDSCVIEFTRESKHLH